MNYYKMYGIIFKSEIPLIKSDKTRAQKSHLYIKIKNKINVDRYKLFHKIYYKNKLVSSFYKSGSKFFVDMHGSGRFLLTKKTIFIENKKNVNSAERTQIVCNQIIPLLLQLNNYTSLHASAVEINNNAYLFVGQSGAGKSTLMGAFAKRNFKIIADDVSLIQIKNNKVYIMPSFSQLRLTNKTFRNIFDKSHSKSKNKKVITGIQYSKKPKQIKRIFLLKKGPRVRSESLETSSFFQLLPHFYRLDLSDPKKLVKELDLLQVILQQGLAHKLFYPRDYNKLPQVVRAIKRA